MQKKMTIEIRNETPAFNESFVSTIDLPALPLRLRDAEQRARLPNNPDQPPVIVVSSCPELPELIDCRLDSPSTEEMNFLASRMDQLTDTQMTAFRALCAVHFANDPMFEEPVPIWQRDLRQLQFFREIPVIELLMLQKAPDGNEVFP